MTKNITRILSPVLIVVIIMTVISGCSKQIDYGENFNLETDCQYSFYGSVTQWKKIQSDGNGRYLLKNNYIYYYSNDTKKLTPLCGKPNCLHDMETDKERQEDCNAYARLNDALSNEYIQYYDGYVYYFLSGFEETCLYRVSKDGSHKDKILTVENHLTVSSWLIHRGQLYYSVQSNFYGENRETQVYTQFTLKSLKLSSHMSEKNAKVIYETNKEHSATNLYDIKAYQNFLCYSVISAPKDFESTESNDWMRVVYSPKYLYNIETGENREIPVPSGNGSYTTIGSVIFLKDRLLVKLYNNLNDVEGDTLYGSNLVPIYSMNYDLTDVKIWLDGVEQAKLVQSYGDYVIISDAMLQIMPDLFALSELHEIESNSDHGWDDIEMSKTNVEIYSQDGKLVSNFVYPMNVKGNFNGFGPDGANVEFDEDDNNWYVYELNFKDVLHCHGETVKLDLISTRSFGALNKYEG